MNLTETEVMELQRRANARTGRAESARHARLIHFRQDGHRLVAEFASHALAREQGDVDEPVSRVFALAFESDELAVREPAELILDGARRLIDQDTDGSVLCVRGEPCETDGR